MKTLYLNGGLSVNPGIYFCIGVKNSSVDIDTLQKQYPNKMKIVNRFREVKSCRYLFEEGHILQPAMIEICKEE